jgi:hypothetical protein
MGFTIKKTGIAFGIGVALVTTIFLSGRGISSPKPPPVVKIELSTLGVFSEGKTLEKYEPTTGCILGAYLDLDPTLTETYRDSNNRVRKVPEPWEQIIGRSHGMYFFYLGYGMPAPTDWIQKLSDGDRFVHIALEPNDGLDAVQDDEFLKRFADDLNQTGAKIFLRFASEMNGPWVNYHGDAKKYIEKFRLISNVMRVRAPNVAMVWCPYTTPKRFIRDYYPGDEYVDWVGVNMYNVTYFDQHLSKPAKHISPLEMLDFVYKTYSPRKPIMIGEYATTHYSPVEGKHYPEWAAKNITQLYGALPKKYPRVKAINYFNCNNLLLTHRKNNNYLLQDKKEVLKAYQTSIASSHFISRASNVPIRPPSSTTAALVAGSVLQQETIIQAKTVASNTTFAYLRFSIDGGVIRSARSSTQADVTLIPSSYEPGWRTFRVDAVTSTGDVVGSVTRKVKILSSADQG